MINKLLILTTLLVPLASAHEFWLEPSKHNVAVNERIDLQWMVGENFQGEAKPRDLSRMVRFEAFSNATREAILGIEKKTPAGILRPITAGDLMLIYESNATRIVLEAPKFDAYLAEEGLESIRAERAGKGEADKPGSESYSRCCKSFVRVGNGPAVAFDKPVGMPLELVPLSDPFAAKKGDKLRVRLLLRGRPLANAQLSYFSREAGGKRQTLKTDAAGEAQIELKDSGRWLISVVHMERADPAKTPDTDWQSWWASMTLEVVAP
ncbi:MAG: DUF4198 domain-containing protein [Phycisphaerae bacterium]|nr:DUF4198 domain-containing protein [Phycisphaerae bacterium]